MNIDALTVELTERELHVKAPAPPSCWEWCRRWALARRTCTLRWGGVI